MADELAVSGTHGRGPPRMGWLWFALEVAPSAIGTGELFRAFADVDPYATTFDLYFRLLVAPTFLLLLVSVSLARGRWRELWRAPCLVAPLALLHPLVPVDAMLGMGFVGLPLFAAGLVQQPNFGPIHLEFALGLGAVLGASVMPVIHATVARRWPDRRLLAAVFALALVPWGAVAWRLDRELVAMGAVAGPLGLIVGQGVWLRAAAILAMGVGTVAGAPDPARR